MPYTLIIDIAVAVLLVVTIGYAVTLNRRLQRLRKDKKDLENLARTFGESTLRAEDNINQLRTVAQALDIQMGRAQSLRDDLAFLNDRGGSAADRLEELVREARDGLGAVPTPPRSAQPKAPITASKEEPDNVEGRSEAERELLRALKDAG